MEVVVTGAGSGIGEEIARQFGRSGHNVFLLDLVGLHAERVAADMRANGYSAQARTVDITKAHDVAKVFKDLESGTGVDVLVNNAGILVPGSTSTLAEADWNRTIEVNLKGTWLCTKYAVPAIKKRGGGAIVNMGSIAGLVGFPDAVAYAASKGGVVHMTKAMALDLAGDGIRVNCVCPGHINTPMGDKFIESHPDPDGFRAEWAATHPLGYFGETRDIATVVEFLASPAARFMSGAVLPVDGGFTAR